MASGLSEGAAVALAGGGLLGGLALLRGVALGYPPPALPGSVLSAKEQAILAAAADALLPPGGPLPLSATQAGVLAHFDRLLRALPQETRLLIRLLLRLLEHGPWLFGPGPRLTRQRPEARARTLEAWSQSRLYLLRVAFTSARTLLAMAYLGEPRVAEQVGVRPSRDPFGRGGR